MSQSLIMSKENVKMEASLKSQDTVELGNCDGNGLNDPIP